MADESRKFSSDTAFYEPEKQEKKISEPPDLSPKGAVPPRADPFGSVLELFGRTRPR